jgi:hypothetical protein
VVEKQETLLNIARPDGSDPAGNGALVATHFAADSVRISADRPPSALEYHPIATQEPTAPQVIASTSSYWVEATPVGSGADRADQTPEDSVSIAVSQSPSVF